MEAEAGFGLKAVRVIFSHCNFGEKELEAVKNLAAIVLEKRWKESGIIFELMNPLSLPKREGERKWAMKETKERIENFLKEYPEAALIASRTVLSWLDFNLQAVRENSYILEDKFEIRQALNLVWGHIAIQKIKKNRQK